jgi:hypothetical protein
MLKILVRRHYPISNSDRWGGSPAGARPPLRTSKVIGVGCHHSGRPPDRSKPGDGIGRGAGGEHMRPIRSVGSFIALVASALALDGD